MTTELVVGAHTAVLIDRSDGRRPRTAGVIPLDGCTLDIVSYRRCIDAYVHRKPGSPTAEWVPGEGPQVIDEGGAL